MLHTKRKTVSVLHIRRNPVSADSTNAHSTAVIHTSQASRGEMTVNINVAILSDQRLPHN